MHSTSCCNIAIFLMWLDCLEVHNVSWSSCAEKKINQLNAIAYLYITIYKNDERFLYTRGCFTCNEYKNIWPWTMDIFLAPSDEMWQNSVWWDGYEYMYFIFNAALCAPTLVIYQSLCVKQKVCLRNTIFKRWMTNQSYPVIHDWSTPRFLLQLVTCVKKKHVPK